MAKKRTKAMPAKERAGWPMKPTAVQVRGSTEWKEWLEAFARAHRQSASGLIDTALAVLAKQTGFKEPPER